MQEMPHSTIHISYNFLMRNVSTPPEKHRTLQEPYSHSMPSSMQDNCQMNEV